VERDPPAIDPTVLLEFMIRLGQAYLASGEQTAQVEQAVRRASSAYGMTRSRVVAFPTAIFVALNDGVEDRVTLAEALPQSLRLDQIADVYALGEAVERAAVTPREGLDRLAGILRKPGRFGPVGILVGHTILTVGVAMVLMPVLTNLAAAALLGAIVGAVKVFSSRPGAFALPMPVLAAALVSGLVFYALRRGLLVDPLHLLVPPLVTFLPGAMLTLGMVELAYGEMVGGASRLTTGFVQLFLLAFGLAAGAALVGVAPESLLEATTPLVKVAWAPWVGVVVFGLGVYVHFSAPRKSLGWVLLVLLAAFAAQRLAAGVFGGEISGFFGMLVATPLAYLVQQRFKGPPAMVTFLPSFWLVVPGALGLLSVTHMLSDRNAGIEGMVTAIYVIVSIALGTLVGASLYRGLTDQVSRWTARIRRTRSPAGAGNRQAGRPPSRP
jgi:uncharacterized membrane protein YjjP (DUF1212 family)